MREFEFIPEGYEGCKVKAWVHDQNGSSEIPQKDYPAVIICPGGAYRMVSDREAEPVAIPFFAAGYNTYILTYSVAPLADGFRPLCQLAATISEIRKHAAKWYTIPDKIAVCGFSAGGHLAASLGVLFNETEFLKIYKASENIRPDALILSYPVITADEFAHVESIENVSGAKEGSEQYQWFGLDRHVDKNTPPTFLWHTAEDPSVPVENSLKMAQALSAAKVPFELHVFPKGGHGTSVCTEEVGSECAYNARWVEWSIKWLQSL
ncbi:MAG: alpha/beta hydrolase [Muricoprocola sp.]